MSLGALLYKNIDILVESAACLSKLESDSMVQAAFKKPKQIRVHKLSIAVLGRGNLTVTGE